MLTAECLQWRNRKIPYQHQGGRNQIFILTTIIPKVLGNLIGCLKITYLESFGVEKCILEARLLYASGVMNPEMQFSCA